MGYPVTVALRYLASKKRNMVSISTALAIGGVTLGVAALTIVMSVTGGFQEQFREKVLGVNAHVLVLKYSIDFREYRDVMKKVEGVPHVIGVAPFVINPDDGDARRSNGHWRPPQGSRSGAHAAGTGPPQAHRRGHARRPRTPGQRSRPSARETPFAGSSMRHAARRLATPVRTRCSDGCEREVDEEMRHADAGVATDREEAIREDGAAAGSAVDDGHGDGRRRRVARPFGAVTPVGGYTSQLPDDDFIPDALDPDPCRSADQVAKMPGIVVGRTLAKQLDVGLGDCLQVTSPQIGISFGSGARPPIAKQFRVIAVFEAGFDQYDSKLVYTDLYEAQAFYEYGDSVTGIEMKLDDIDRADAVARDMATRLNNGIYNTMTWHQLNHGLFTALLIQQIGMSFMLGLIILVAACTVIATLIMVVLEKKKEIALLKAIGAKNDAILRIFLYQGGIIGLAGTALGVFVGWVSCRCLLAYRFPLDAKVYFISRLPVSMHPVEFIVPAIVAVAICLVATILPAVYAAQLRPADGLRAE